LIKWTGRHQPRFRRLFSDLDKMGAAVIDLAPSTINPADKALLEPMAPTNYGGGGL